MKNPLLLLILAVPVVLAASCTSTKYRDEDLSRVFRYNESKGISSLDPAYARNQTIIWPVSQLFNGLLQMDDSLDIRPALARRWEISDDGTVYTFHLRTDVRFHDDPVFPGGTGRLVTAADVAYSFSRILDPSVASPGLWVLGKLDRGKPDHPEGFRALDDSTFRIWLNEPFPRSPASSPCLIASWFPARPSSITGKNLPGTRLEPGPSNSGSGCRTKSSSW